MIDDGNAECKRFIGASQLGVGNVHVMDVQVLAVFRRDKRLPEIVNVFELVTQPCGIVQVHEFRRAV